MSNADRLLNKYNPNHDEKGRFAAGDGGGGDLGGRQKKEVEQLAAKHAAEHEEAGVEIRDRLRREKPKNPAPLILEHKAQLEHKQAEDREALAAKHLAENEAAKQQPIADRHKAERDEMLGRHQKERDELDQGYKDQIAEAKKHRGGHMKAEGIEGDWANAVGNKLVPHHNAELKQLEDRHKAEREAAAVKQLKQGRKRG